MEHADRDRAAKRLHRERQCNDRAEGSRQRGKRCERPREEPLLAPGVVHGGDGQEKKQGFGVHGGLYLFGVLLDALTFGALCFLVLLPMRPNTKKRIPPE